MDWGFDDNESGVESVLNTILRIFEIILTIIEALSRAVASFDTDA
ncbi:MAG: hypothetical protein ACLFTT_16875 [Candidatus Hydrogenedentota bacterium]